MWHERFWKWASYLLVAVVPAAFVYADFVYIRPQGAQIENLKGTLAAKNAEIGSLRVQATSEKNQIATMKEELDLLRKKNTELETNIETLRQRNDGIRRENEQLIKTKDRLQLEIDQFKSEKIQLTSHIVLNPAWIRKGGSKSAFQGDVTIIASKDKGDIEKCSGDQYPFVIRRANQILMNLCLKVGFEAPFEWKEKKYSFRLLNKEDRKVGTLKKPSSIFGNDPVVYDEYDDFYEIEIIKSE
jgi:hypothetical protein